MSWSLLVEAENPIMGERRLTTLAHMTYVAVGKDLRPAPVDICIEPRRTRRRRSTRTPLRGGGPARRE
ncbi:MAG: hypothetical protein MGAcid_02830 [uncultured Acidilobus sp. MG]|nr:MAG: hypothetical protein MGAcid_02830 [uncultured Acidilobus sp. MG]